MAVPVARALHARGLADVQVLGLTTAAPVVREAGLPLLQVKDLVGPADAPALARGATLAAALGTVADPQESAAYLGLCYEELVAEVGEAEAAQRYAAKGRQAFLPVRLLQRVLRHVRPQLVVVTNSPRGERAAAIAAGLAGIPSVCVVDLFAIDEVAWIGQPGYTQRVLVLNEAVRDFLVQAGRRPDEVLVTGNPAFDPLNAPQTVARGRALRAAQGWAGRRVVLWPEQVEPALHPFDNRPGDPTLPAQTLQALRDWTDAHPDTLLCVRPRPGQALPELGGSPRVLLTGQDWPLHPLLHAVDAVATLNSTVGLEGRLAGARLVQTLGSVFDQAMPLARFGLADAAVALPDLPAAIERVSRLPRHPTDGAGEATGRVVDALRPFL